MLCVSLALAGLLVVRRLVPLPISDTNNAVIGITYAATYVLYGLTLGFSLYLGNQEASEARETVEREAANLEGIVEIAQQLPQPERDRIQEVTESYARTVVEDEWPLMGGGANSQVSSQAESLLDELQESVLGYEPETSAEQALYSQGMTLVFGIEDEREIRLLHSRQDSHTLLWYVLVVGAVITVLHSFFFGSKVVWLQGLSVAAMTTVIVLVLSTNYELQAPFAGSARVEPEAFEEVLDDTQRQQL